MSFEKDIQAQAGAFLNKIFANINEVGIDLQNWPIDHLCYRTSSLQNYELIKAEFQSIGTLLVESEINGRQIATYKLHQPIEYHQRRIDVVEVPAPKEGKATVEGFEHIEAVIDISFDHLMKIYDHLTFNTKALAKSINQDIELEFKDCAIKFHHQSLEEVIKLEKGGCNLERQ